MKKRLVHFKSKSEKGQSIVLIALVFVGLLAFIGLTVDLGMLFVSYGNLRRAVDNAALAAATQMRENYTITDLENSASQFLNLNNVKVDPSAVQVQTCATDPTDTQLCPTDRRKLVRVTAEVPVQFSFISVIGFYETTISANAMAEAASMDVVLVIDISESMTEVKDASGGFISREAPVVCNAGTSVVNGHTINNACDPFKYVIDAGANTFVDYILNKDPAEEEDRVAIVVFSNGWEDRNYYYTPGYASGVTIPTRGTGYVCPYGDWIDPDGDGIWDCANPWISDSNVAKDLINNLKVYQPVTCDYPTIENMDQRGPCSSIEPADGLPAIGTAIDPFTGSYLGGNCPYGQTGNIAFNTALGIDVVADPSAAAEPDGSSCSTTNIGGGLQLGASLFGMEMRKDALWLLVLLTDGVPNATEFTPDTDPDYFNNPGSDNTTFIQTMPVGHCPDLFKLGTCRDKNTNTRHLSSAVATYDAEDFGRDMADLVSCDAKIPAASCNSTGQGATMFAIGLSQTVINSKDTNTPAIPYGDRFLRYIGAVGDDGDPATDSCSAVPYPTTTADYDCGNYYYSEFGTGLDAVFQQIASRVFTRITR
jgi:Flp pilus assembly protein TadG